MRGACTSGVWQTAIIGEHGELTLSRRVVNDPDS
jgi:hypothetical protein